MFSFFKYMEFKSGSAFSFEITENSIENLEDIDDYDKMKNRWFWNHFSSIISWTVKLGIKYLPAPPT